MMIDDEGFSIKSFGQITVITVISGKVTLKGGSHAPGIYHMIIKEISPSKQHCLDLSERPKHAPFRGASLLRLIGNCEHLFSMVFTYAMLLCKDSYTSVLMCFVYATRVALNSLGGAFPKRAVFRCWKLNLSVLKITRAFYYVCNARTHNIYIIIHTVYYIHVHIIPTHQALTQSIVVPRSWTSRKAWQI